MNNRSEKMAFYCEMCKKFLKSNVCPTCGIDFVTIKKPPVRRPNNPGSVHRADKKSRMTAEEKRIATTNPTPGEKSYLPALTKAPKRGKPLKPTKKKKGFSSSSSAQNQDDFLREAIEAEFSRNIHAQYEEDDDLEVEDYINSNVRDPFSRSRKSSGKGLLISTLIGLLVLAAAIGFFVLNNQGALTSTEMYSKAETLYNQGQYDQALVVYQKFTELHPNDPLIPLVAEKINKLSREQNADGEVVLNSSQQNQIEALILKTNIAFQKQQYIYPEEDNALSYIAQVLAISPNHSTALATQDKIYQYYEEQAMASVNSGNYNEALKYYHRILQIRPGDTYILNKAHSIVTQKGKDLKP